MTREEALQWLEANNAKKFNQEEDRFLQVDTPNDGTKYLVSVSPRISANGSTLEEATEKCERIQRLETRKELVRKKYVSAGLIN